MTLKVNLHLHTADDPKDNVSYSFYQLINHAENLGFDVLAITCHQKFVYKKEYEDYAIRKGILFLPGIELKIEDQHVVALNCNKKAENVKTFEELKNYKNQNPQIFVLAPHPFVWSKKSLKSKLLENINLFDAIELSVFSNKIFNFNKKAKAVAEKYNKPLIATSDTHFLKDLNRNYSLIDAGEKTVESILQAIKEKKYENKIKTMHPLAMLEFKTKGVWRHLLNFLPVYDFKFRTGIRNKRRRTIN